MPEKVKKETEIEENPTSSEGSNPEGQEGASPPTSQTDPGGEPTSEPTAEEAYNNRFLDGRSKDEIGTMFSSLTDQLRNVGAELNAIKRQPAPAPVPQPEDDLDELALTNPSEAMRRVMQQELGKMIEPFNEDRRLNASVMARQTVRQEFDDWQEVEPYVDTLLRETGQPEDINSLRALYYSAKGMRDSGVFARMGYGAAPSSTPSPAPSNRGQNMPPQHPASKAPLPSGSADPAPELNEHERRLAREWGMTAEEYKGFQNMDEGAVVSSDIGMEKKS